MNDPKLVLPLLNLYIEIHRLMHGSQDALGNTLSQAQKKIPSALQVLSIHCSTIIQYLWLLKSEIMMTTTRAEPAAGIPSMLLHC